EHRTDKREKNQRLDHPEDQRERVVQHGPQLAEHHDADVARQARRARRGDGGGQRGGHAALLSEVAASRRLRPVRVRKTSSRVGRCTWAVSTGKASAWAAART